MAGSQTWRTYTADNGDKFSVSVNKGLANGIFRDLQTGTSPLQLFPPRNDNYPPLPRGYRMRLLNMRSSLPDVLDSRLNIRVPFGNLEIVRLLGLELPVVEFSAGVYAIGTYYDIASYQGEFRLISLGSLQYDG